MKRWQVILWVLLIALGLVGCEEATQSTETQPNTSIALQSTETQPNTTIVSPPQSSTQPYVAPIVSAEMLIDRIFEYKNKDLHIWMQISFHEDGKCGILESPYLSTWPRTSTWQLEGNVLWITTSEGKIYYFVVEQDAILFDRALSDEFAYAPELPDEARFTPYGE